MKIEQLEKLFKTTFTKNYNLSYDSDTYLRITDKKDSYVKSGTKDEMQHFINCVYLAKNRKILKLKNSNYVTELGFLFGMLISKKVYGGINLDTILNDSYIKQYDIDDRIKLFFANYVDSIIKNIRYGGDDYEGNRYNTCDYAPLN